MAPHRIPVDFDSTNSSVSGSDFPKGDRTDIYPSGSDDASNPKLSEPEPIAIVGMGMSTLLSPGPPGHLLTCEKGCRLPGDVRSPSSLWNLLMEQRSGQFEVPAGRWNIDSFYHSNSEKGGSMNMRGGYFIKEDLR